MFLVWRRMSAICCLVPSVSISHSDGAFSDQPSLLVRRCPPVSPNLAWVVAWGGEHGHPRLTEKGIEHAKPPKGRRAIMIPDGGNLYLQATIGGNGGINRSWLFRYELDGARHDMGLGPVTTLRLAEAREQARQLRQQIIAGIDPLGARNEQKAERKASAGGACGEGEGADVPGVRREVPRRSRRQVEEPQACGAVAGDPATYAHPIIGDLNVADIDEAHLVRVLEPIWRKMPETARRVRGRIEAVLGYATVSKFRTGDNPARWHNHLQTLLGGTQKAVEHHAAIPFAEIPAFMVELRGRKSTSAPALEFAGPDCGQDRRGDRRALE